ncbi:MAG: HAMP domain-containing histidine kinase [Alphaproteobacteria bacterium]|nr:HAMP domain-containing histidine kinase [Alphaproteobacteria bacterium]
MEAILDGIIQLSDIVGVRVVESNGETAYMRGRIPDDAEDASGDGAGRDGWLGLFSHHFPVLYEGRKVASIHFYSSGSIVFDKVKLSFLIMVIAAALKTVLLWFLFMWAFKRFLVSRLNAFTRQMESADFANLNGHRADFGDGGAHELARLATVYNAMIERLADAKSELETLNREVEDRVRLRTHEAEQARRAKSEFLSSMSHELRTPLNAILGFAQLMGMNAKEPLTNTQARCVEQIIGGGQHLLELVEQVLDLARIETGRLNINIGDVPVTPTVEECVALVTPQAEERAIKIETGLGHSGAVRADRMRMKQVLLNLMSNAVKYNTQGGWVKVSTRSDESGMVRIDITDTGPGIPEAMKDKVFEPFDRLGKETSEVSGAGVGLTVTKQLVEAMGGRIGFSSRPGVGSVFWVELPAAR